METPEGLQGVIILLIMPTFFVSNAFCPVETFPTLLKTLSLMNPPSYLASGIRNFAIGPDFYFLGIRYTSTTNDVFLSFVFHTLFTLCTYMMVRWRFGKATVT